MEWLVYDIETNGLLRNVSEIHCVVTVDVETEVACRYHDYHSLPREGSLDEGLNRIANADVLIGHNIGSYDDHVVETLGKKKLKDGQVNIDTMLQSCILHPEMQKNSLEEWAKKLDLEESKIQNTDWSRLTSNILTRCVSDCRINLALFRHLLGETKELHRRHGDVLRIGDALALEYKIARIHAKQVVHGVGYDVLLATRLVNTWDAILGGLANKIKKLAPKRCVPPYKTDVSKIFLKQTKKEKKDGKPKKYTQAVKNWFGEDLAKANVQGEFHRIQFEEINLNSGDQVKAFLLKLGWVPTEWNWKEDEYRQRVKTSPKLTEDSYVSLPPGLGKDIAHYNVLKHRRSLLLNLKDKEQGSLGLARKTYNPETGLGNVPSDAFTCGTPTARYRHKKPVANLPGIEALYGWESREVYVPPYGTIQVGADLSGIEARMLCHLCWDYPGGKEFAEMVLEGDWHSHNASLWNVQRRIAKVILYAMMYGAGDAKLGKEANGNAKRGAEIRAAFLEGNPAYAKLVSDLEDAYKINGGFIPSMDGRPLYPRTKKDILNTTIQGNSAVVFKKWMVNCDNLEEVKLRIARQMIAYHDELQFAYYAFNEEYHAECFAQRVCEQALRTGQQMGLHIPVAAEYKVGYSYAACH